MTLFKIKQKIGETFEIDVKEDGSKIECSLPTCKDSTICKHVFLASREKCIKEYEKEKQEGEGLALPVGLEKQEQILSLTCGSV